MKYILIIFLIAFSLNLNAQKVEKDGKTYQVKNEKIFLDGKDVTETLSLADKEFIFKKAAMTSERMKGKGNDNGKTKGKEKAEDTKMKEEKMMRDKEKAMKAAEKAEEKKEKEAKKLEKDIKKAEKAQKRAEKEAKKAEKALKKKQKAQDRFDKANKKLKSAQKKYDKLKRKGKLSPNDEAKWLDKLEDLKEDIAKAKKKM